MAVLFGVLALLFFLLYLREWAGNRSLNREILYIRERVAALSCGSGEGNGYVLIPSENAQIRELAAALNRLLESFYLQRADFGRSRRAMGQMLTNISHDLRTPLTVLRGYSELLSRAVKEGEVSAENQDIEEARDIEEAEEIKEARDIEEAQNTKDISNIRDIREMVSKIDSRTEELVEAVNRYFTLAKIESGDRKPELQRLDLTELCHEVILDYYDDLEKAGCEVDIQIAPHPLFACADEDALERILKNLIDNAITHGGDGRYLGLRLREVPGGAAIEIEDHGPGIAAENREAVFSRNYTTARGRAGSGLGLAIAKNLAQQMGADIRVSGEPGERTVFTLRLKCESSRDDSCA